MNFKTIIISSLLLLPLPILANEEKDLCQTARQMAEQHKEGVLSVININRTDNRLYSSTIYYSTDCNHYVKQFTVLDPEVVRGKNHFCMLLMNEMKAGMCGVKVELCLEENKCQTATFKLQSDKSQYIAATPQYVDFNFDKS